MSDKNGIASPPVAPRNDLIAKATELIGPDKRFPLAKVQRELRISCFQALDLCKVLVERGVCRPFEPVNSNQKGIASSPAAFRNDNAEAVPHEEMTTVPPEKEPVPHEGTA